jgi:hypothetical protein
MKLHQQLTSPLQLPIGEAQGPISAKLILSKIVEDGKVTDNYQIFVLGWISEFFKNGLKSAALELENPITFGSGATSTVVVQGLKEMTPENQVQLAQYLIGCIDAGECALHHKEMNIVEWIRYVTQAQR